MANIVRCGLIQAKNEIAAPLGGSNYELIMKMKEAMTAKHLKFVEAAAAQKVQILCFQEIFTGPYFCAEQNPIWYDATEKIPEGPTIQIMQKAAKQHNMVLIVPIYEIER